MNVILIGFKSCGKSTVGRLLAERRRLTFVDLDEVMVALFRERFGVQWNCWEFYFSYGADKFRDLETEALQQQRSRQDMVLATGGGAPLRPENREELAALGTVCYINAAPEILFDRMRRRQLPAYLSDKPTLANLRRLWFYRDDVYRKLADLVIDAGDHDPQAIAEEIDTGLDEAHERR